LEREKAAMSVFSPAESQLICERFADKVFQTANAQDQAGVATKDTAKTFYAAASFLEILHQFQMADAEPTEESEEQNQKRIFCKWKATEILKAIKEGRTPTPGGYDPVVEDEDVVQDMNDTDKPLEDQPESITAPEPDIPLPPQLELPPPPMEMASSYQEEEGTEVDLFGPPPAYAPPPLDDDLPVVDIRPPIVMMAPPVIVPPPTRPATAPSSTGMFARMRHTNSNNHQNTNHVIAKATKAQLADATELTTFALMAFKSGDAELGATRLQEALTALGR
jgi:vacuolar protein sorting-associated protein VTA1